MTFSLSTTVFAAAQKYALLIGISQYPVRQLSGPINDALAMQQVLIENWGFQRDKITVLLDKQGTRENILSNVSKLYAKTSRGDFVVIYLSGHGTSALDQSQNLPLPTTSGAFIPYDIDNLSSDKEIVEKLIIGRRDLRPLLTQLDKGGRNVFVVIDACFSGNTVRDKQAFPLKGLSIDDLRSAKHSNGQTEASHWLQNTSSHSNEKFPYRNIYYLSAASENEAASDIPPRLLAIHPTIDGRPHGAFTDSLLRILNEEISADINQDGKITYAELKTSVRNLMRLRGFNHTPQGLPPLAEDDFNLANRVVFERKKVRASLAHSDNNKIINNYPLKFNRSDNSIPVLASNNIASSLRNKLRNNTDISLVKSNYLLEIDASDNNILIKTNAGDQITSLPSTDSKGLDRVIRQQISIDKLTNGPYQQSFDLDVNFSGVGRGSTIVEGQDIGISARASENAYYLIVNINTEGMFNILYPANEIELRLIKAYATLDLPNFGKPQAPFGREYIIVYAFAKKYPELATLMGKTFSRESSLFNDFSEILEKGNTKSARSSLQLVTVKKTD